MPVTITALNLYPVKSCAGIPLHSATLDARGFAHDREWMIVQDDDDERGMFLTQRELPELALVQPALSADTLTLRAPNLPDLAVSLAPRDDARTLPVVIWRDTCVGVDEGDAAAAWLSDYLDLPVRLVRMQPGFVRPVDLTYAKTPAQTGFADGYPILVISEASLADLNVRLGERGKATVPMARFRPNIVVSGCEAYAEDEWTRIEIGGVPLDCVKTCARCPITTVDPATGTIPDVQEPLATLATYRKISRGVIFGQNVIHRGLGTISVGDEVRLL
jgi:uncharacterized protein